MISIDDIDAMCDKPKSYPAKVLKNSLYGKMMFGHARIFADIYHQHPLYAEQGTLEEKEQ